MDTIFQNPATSDRFYFCVSPTHYQCVMKYDVLYMEAASRGYVHVHLENGTRYELSTNLGNVENQFGNNDFIRISRQYLVNFRRVSSIKGSEVRVANIRLEMSKTGSQRLFAQLPFLWMAQLKALSRQSELSRIGTREQSI